MSATAITMQKIREEIEAPLRAENAKLRAALEEIVKSYDPKRYEFDYTPYQIAIDALANKETK